MSARKRSRTERQNDLRRIASRLLRGASQTELAAELSLSRSQLSYDTKEVHRLWQEQAAIDTGARVAKELAKLGEVEAETWRRLDAAAPDAPHASSLIGRLLECSGRRCRLLGMDAPQRREVRLDGVQIEPRQPKPPFDFDAYQKLFEQLHGAQAADPGANRNGVTNGNGGVTGS